MTMRKNVERFRNEAAAALHARQHRWHHHLCCSSVIQKHGQQQLQQQNISQSHANDALSNHHHCSTPLHLCLLLCLPVSAVTHLFLIYHCLDPTCADMLMHSRLLLSHRSYIATADFLLRRDCWHQNMSSSLEFFKMKILFWHRQQ